MSLAVGQRVRGRIIHIAPFGAFIDLGDDQWTGLVLVHQIAWSPIYSNPTTLLTVGQEVETEIVSIDLERHRISLSIKRCQENPWETASHLYKIGQALEGIIWRRMTWGVIACLKDYPAVCGVIDNARDCDLAEGHSLQLYLVNLDVERERAQFSLQPPTR